MSAPQRGGSRAAGGARLAARPPPPSNDASLAPAPEGAAAPAAGGASRRPVKQSLESQRKVAAGRMKAGKQEMMSTGFETIRMPKLEKLQGAVQAPAKGTEAHESLSDVLAVLNAAQITGEELWAGNARVRPLLKHFNRELRAVKLHDTTLVNFTFPHTPEFGNVDSKTYKVERLMPISRVVAQVLGRLGVGQPSRFTLSTLEGFVLPDAHCLADYGLGSLLPNWELLIVDKATAQREARDEALARSGTNAVGPEAAGRVSLLILFEGAGWPVTLQRLLIAPSITLGSVLETLIEKHNYTAHPASALEFRTFEDDPCDPSATLENYGLGQILKKWALKLVSPPAPVTVAPTATDAAPAGQPAASTSVPAGLEELLLQIKQENEQLRAELERARAAEAEQAAANDKAMKRAQNLRAHLEAERQTLKKAAEEAEQRRGEVEQALRAEQAERQRDEEKHAKRVESLEAQLRGTKAQGDDEEQEFLEKSLTHMARVVENLEMELQHAQTRLQEQKQQHDDAALRAKEKAQLLQEENDTLHLQVVKLQEALEAEIKARESLDRRAQDLSLRLQAAQETHKTVLAEDAPIAHAEPSTDAKLVSIPEPAPTAVAQPVPAPAPEPEPVPEPKVEPKVEPQPEPKAEPQPEAAPASVPAAEADYEPFEPEDQLIRQWVHSIEAYSSQAADLGDEGDESWAASQLIGPPKVTGYGDSPFAWAPLETNGGAEWVICRVERRVKVREVLILESWNPGAVCRVEVRKDKDWVTIWSQPAAPAPEELRIIRCVPQKLLDFATDAVRIHLDTAAVFDEWNEIAAVQVAGLPVEAPPPPPKTTSAAAPPPPPPPMMTLPPPRPKSSPAAAAPKAAPVDLMTEILTTAGRAGLRSVKAPHASQKEKPKAEAGSIAEVLLKRFEAMHGVGKYEDLGKDDDWEAVTGDAKWDDDDDWV